MAYRIHFHCLPCCLLTALLLLSSPVPAEESAKELLNKMTRAVQSLSYEGTFVFMHGDEIDTMKIVHGHDGGGVRERLVSLTGEPREVIRNRNVLTCYWPGSQFVVVEISRKDSALPTAIPAKLDDLKNYYHFEVGDTSRIAGRDCRMIEIRPLDDSRYGYRFCVAEQSGMLLKSQMVSPDGETIEQVMFTEFSLRDSIPKKRFEPTMSGEDYTWHTIEAREHLAELRPDPGWRIGDMPPGFSLTENVKRPIAASAQPVQHMILTDGLASVSVFIAKPETRREFFQGITHSGAINAYATHQAGHQITVVGEVPKKTVEMIGDSIIYKDSVTDRQHVDSRDD